LWLNQETVHRFHLAVLATMRPALDPAGHRVPRTKATCLLHTWRPHRQRPFALILHLHQHESSRNLHLQYLAKNQSTQCCQSLITQGSDHPPVLEPHMVLTVAAAARGKPARRPDAGQLASVRATLESIGATGVVDRRRARAVSSSTGRRRQWQRAARDGARRGARGFYTRLGASVGDGG
jgi:hypothetical protein